MVNGLLRVEDLIDEDETRVLLQVRDGADERLDVEILKGGATPEAMIRLFRTVRHPSLPVLLGRIDLDGMGPAVAYAAVPSIPGTALLDGVLPSVRAVLRVIERVAGALMAAHAGGICHRDLHLGQIRLEASGVVRLHGWGAAAAGVRRRRLTFENAASLAPEALQRKDVWGSDVYALGVVFWELLSGQRATPASVAQARSPAFVERIRARAPELEPALVDEIVALVRAMVREEWESRPLAMEVARRCQRLGAELRGTDLVRYAGDRVPAVLAVRSPSAGWAGRRLLPKQTAPAPQLGFNWALAR